MRVLHLIDAASPQACATTLAMLSDALGRLGDVDQQVLLLGGAALRDDAAAAGVMKAAPTIVQGVPHGRAMLGWFAVRRRLAELGRFDLVHCWSGGALTLAALMLPRVPRVLTLTQPPSLQLARWLRVLAAESRGRSVILPISSTIRRAVLRRGVDESIVHVLRPAIDLGRVMRGRRGSLRESWGIEPDGRRARIIALLADPPRRHDARQSTLAVSIAAEAYSPRHRSDGPKLYVLAHPEQRNAIAARDLMRYIGVTATVILDPRLAWPWDTLAACDLAIAAGDGAGGLATLWAMAASTPIIGEATYAVSEILEDRHSALLARPDQVRLLANRLNQLIDDPQLAWRLRDTARHECYSFFSRQRYCTSLQRVYQQIVENRPIEIAPLESTGGLRFTGRG